MIPLKTSKVCLWCGKGLPKRRRKYCSDDCHYTYWQKYLAPLWWNNATAMALDRANHVCETCGGTTKLEVHHIIPLDRFEARHNSPKNAQDNLQVLCRDCHEKAHHPYAGIPPANRTPKEQLAMAL